MIDVESTAVASTFLGSVGAENNEVKRELLNLHHFTCLSHVHVHYMCVDSLHVTLFVVYSFKGVNELHVYQLVALLCQRQSHFLVQLT